MTVTPMAFAICIPDWGSLDSVRSAHTWMEGLAIGCFAALVAFDVLAHMNEENKTLSHLLEKVGLCFFAIAVIFEIAGFVYGQRNDTLSENVIASLDSLANGAESKAAKALVDSGTALAKADTANGTATAAEVAAGKAKKKADGASAEADDITRRLAWRHIDPKKREAFRKELAPFGGSLSRYMLSQDSNPETFELTDEIIAVLKSGGWATEDTHNVMGNFTGVTCFVSSDPNNNAARAIADVLKQFPNTVVVYGDVGSPVTAFCKIGSKPPA